MKLDPNWISWANNTVRMLKDGGYMIFPRDGAIFQVNKTSKTLELICCVPEWLGSDIENINRLVFNKIEYHYVKPESVPTTPEGMIDKIFGHLQKYASDIPMLLHGIGVIFGFKRENEAQDDKVIALIKKQGKSLPINPVTIRGRNVLNTEPGNLTVGRLWIGVDTISDSAHRFDPKVKRVARWEKPITLILWKNEHDMKGVAGDKSHLVVEEEEFIPAIKRLKSESNIVLKVWGKLTRLGDETASVVFRRSTQHGNMLVTIYTGEDNKTEAANVTLDFDKFVEGLGHLFPNGELS
jgi:hypothetical protein